jgi:orotidine-5'-phosphate decarboxylase
MATARNERPIFENPIFCALDTADLDSARALLHRLKGSVGGFKLGLEFFAGAGPQGMRALAQEGSPIFLDLKLHDIPNTVARALKALVPLGARLITVHAGGGTAMLQAAVDATHDLGPTRPLLLGVTVLTSLDDDDLADLGVPAGAQAQTLKLARLSIASGLDGLVCSAHEVAALRVALGPAPLLVVPGIRPKESASADQKRVATASDALAQGADILVVGRPITEARDPVAAARAIMAA